LAVGAVSAKVSVMFTNTSRPPVLLLHGFLGSPEDWASVCHAWQPEQPVHAFDISSAFCMAKIDPNSEENGIQRAKPFEIEKIDSAEPSLEAWDAILHRIVAYMDRQDVGPWDIVGYSMGGRIAWMLAHRYPHRVSRLAILSANPGISDADERRIRAEKDHAWAMVLRAEGMSSFLNRWYAQPLFDSFRQHPIFQGLMKKRVAENPEPHAQILKSLSPALQPDLWSWVLSSEIPTLYLSGAYDSRYTQIGKRLSANRAVTHETIPDAGHVLHLESPNAVAEALSCFFRSE